MALPEWPATSTTTLQGRPGCFLDQKDLNSSLRSIPVWGGRYICQKGSRPFLNPDDLPLKGSMKTHLAEIQVRFFVP